MKIHFFYNIFVANFKHVLFYFSVFMWTVSMIFEVRLLLIREFEILLAIKTTHSSPGYFAFTYWLAATTTVKIIVQPHPQHVLSFMYYNGHNVQMIRFYYKLTTPNCTCTITSCYKIKRFHLAKFPAI